MAIQFIDLCSGIGGFHSGLMATGHFMCVGHAEIWNQNIKNNNEDAQCKNALGES